MENRELMEKKEKIMQGLELAYQKLIEFKRMKNSPLIISKNGKVIKLDPNEAPPTTTYKR